MERKKVYELIDGERAYQDSKPPRPEGDAVTPVSAWVIYLEKQIQEAKESIYYLDTPKAMAHVRKIAALAVACMEYNDTPSREAG